MSARTGLDRDRQQRRSCSRLGPVGDKDRFCAGLFVNKKMKSSPSLPLGSFTKQVKFHLSSQRSSAGCDVQPTVNSSQCSVVFLLQLQHCQRLDLFAKPPFFLSEPSHCELQPLCSHLKPLLSTQCNSLNLFSFLLNSATHIFWPLCLPHFLITPKLMFLIYYTF